MQRQNWPVPETGRLVMYAGPMICFLTRAEQISTGLLQKLGGVRIGTNQSMYGLQYALEYDRRPCTLELTVYVRRSWTGVVTV